MSSPRSHLVLTAGNGYPMHKVYITYRKQEEEADKRIMVKEKETDIRMIVKEE